MEIFKLFGSVFINNDKANQQIDDTDKKGKGLAGTFTNFIGAAAKAGGALAVAAGGAAAVFGVGALNAAQDFQKEMANVGTLLDGDVKTKIGNLGGAVKELSKSTGATTTLLTDGLYQVISAFGESEESMKILETAAKGAAAGNATVTDSVNLLSAVTKGYGDTSAEAAKKASDLSFLTVKLGQTTFPELAASMGAVIPLASTMKVKQEELFGAMATLTGVTGGTAEVTTQLRATIQGFLQPSKDMATALQKLGYENGQTAIESEGLGGILTKLKESVGGNEIAFSNLFSSVEAKGAVLALTGSQADNFTQKTNAMKEAVGATEDAFGKQRLTIDKVKASFNTIVITLGEKLLPAYDAFLDWTIQHMPQIQAVVEKVFSVISVAITFVVGQVIPRVVEAFNFVKNNFDVIGPALSAMLLWVIVPAFITWATAAGAAAIATITAMAPVLIPIALVGAAVAGLALAWRQWGDDISQTVVGLWEGVKTAFSNAANNIMDFLRQWGPLILAVITGPIGLIVYGVTKHWDDIKAKTVEIWDSIKEFIGNAFSWLYDHNYYFKNLVDAITGFWNSLKETTERVWNEITGWLDRTWNTISGTAAAIWNGIASKLSGVWSEISRDLKNAWDNISGTAKTVWGKVSSTITSIADDIRDSLSGLANKAWDWGRNLLNSFIDGIKSKIASLKNIASEAVGAVAGFLGFHSPAKEGPGSDADTWAPNLVQMFAKGIRTGIPDIKEAVADAALMLNGIGANLAVNLPSGAALQPAAAAPGTTIFNLNFSGPINVRDDNDIKAVSSELYSLAQSAQRGSGGRRP